VIDVEQRALRTLEQQALAGLLHGVQIAGDILDHGRDGRRQSHGLVADLGGRHGGRPQVLGEDEVMVVEQFGELFVEQRGIEQVLHAQGAARDLVFVGRADAAARGADLALALAGFARLVDGDVVRQDQRTDFRNLQARADIQASGLEFFDFLEQRLGRQHHAVADEAGNAGMHDARRNQPQDGFLAVDPQRMAGIVAALEAHHALDGFGQPVDDLAFAFVTPLGADNHYVLAHCTNRYRVSREIRKSPCGPLG